MERLLEQFDRENMAAITFFYTVNLSIAVLYAYYDYHYIKAIPIKVLSLLIFVGIVALTTFVFTQYFRYALADPPPPPDENGAARVGIRARPEDAAFPWEEEGLQLNVRRRYVRPDGMNAPQGGDVMQLRARRRNNPPAGENAPHEEGMQLRGGRVVRPR